MNAQSTRASKEKLLLDIRWYLKELGVPTALLILFVCGRWRHVTKNIIDAYEHTFECSFLAPAACKDSCDWCQVIDPSCDSVGCLADGMAAAANIRQQRRQDEIECQHVG